ncbi:MAG TPA: hypothetical protein DF383_08370 [Deltaproteobacteria bacterium]|nr:hypothetical protein [Deltaproteobacteria bacterium]
MRSETKKMMDYCTYCPKMCRFSCPAAEATDSETYTPWGKMQIARWLMDETVPLSESMATALYQCSNCLHCQEYCEHGNDVPSALAEARRLAVEDYAAPAAVYALEERFRRANNPYGEALLSKARPLLAEAPAAERAEVLLFPSCHTLWFFPQRIQVYFELFRKLGVGPVALATEEMACCGDPLDALGLRREFQEVAEVQYHSLKSFKVIVSDGPECCNALKNKYTGLHFPLRRQSVHLLEFLEPYLRGADYRSRGKTQGRFAYYDPVFLSRYLGLIEAPRRILRDLTGFSPLELSWSGKDSLSSGIEAGYDLLFPEASERIAQRTVDELASRGIGKLVTACAKSEAKFRELAGSELEVQDLFEFLNEHIL